MPQSSAQPKRIALLISGRGSNMVAIADAIADGRLHAEIACVISNRAEAEGLHKAADRGIPTCVIPHKGLTRDEHARQFMAVLNPLNVSLICLAGYMRLLAPEFIQAFRHQIVNIHPSLLPAFPGLHAQAQAIEYGVKFSGCTVHFVDEELDHGPIIAQALVPVYDTDTEETLSARILVEEHKLYPSAIERVLQEPWELCGRRISFLSEARS